MNIDHARACGETDAQDMVKLNRDECAVVRVNADSYWNASGLLMENDASYDIYANEGEYWCDAGIKCGAAGWRTQDEVFEACDAGDEPPAFSGLSRWLFSKAEKYRRYPAADWFELIGVIGKNNEYAEFIIGPGVNYTAEMSGEFCAYANDMKMFYWNNTKSLMVTIKRSD